MTKKIVTVGDADVSVDYATNYYHEYFCNFTIWLGDIATVYAIGMPAERFRALKGNALHKYLLENLHGATVVRPFHNQSRRE